MNWKVRARNPHFKAQVFLSFLLPILAYMGLTLEDLTTWGALGRVLWDAVQNPYVIMLATVSVYNAVTDPTTKGIKDSELAKTYDTPR